jgi:hypothetical protein
MHGMRFGYDDTKTAIIVPLPTALLKMLVLTLHTALYTDYFLLIKQLFEHWYYCSELPCVIIEWLLL